MFSNTALWRKIENIIIFLFVNFYLHRYKGLLVDYEKGNILKLGRNGVILR